MTTTETTIVSRLWNYCNILRDDGVSYGDYVEQLTFLLFLKMADEQTHPPFNKPSIIPAGQYFSPRELIRAMFEVTRPAPMQTLCDPACGTGGFFLAAQTPGIMNIRGIREFFVVR